MSYIHFLLSSFLLTSLMCGFSCHFLIAFQAVCWILLVFSRVQSGLSPEEKLYKSLFVIFWWHCYFYGAGWFFLIFIPSWRTWKLELFCFWSFSRRCHLVEEVGLRVVMVGREDFHRFPSHGRLLVPFSRILLLRASFGPGLDHTLFPSLCFGWMSVDGHHWWE